MKPRSPRSDAGPHTASNWLVGVTTRERVDQFRLPGEPSTNPAALARGRARRRLEDLQIDKELGLR